MMTFQREVLEDVAAMVSPPMVINNWEAIADVLSNNFPWKGSKIDWGSLIYHAEEEFYFNNGNLKEQIKSFMIKHHLESYFYESKSIYYVNDSSLDIAFSITPLSFLDFAAYATGNIPQHHYFFDCQGKWCLAVTSEGYIDFGVSS